MKRTFIAIPFEPNDRFNNLFQQIQSISEGASMKWIDPFKMHITLAFLGDVTAVSEEVIVGKLSELVEDLSVDDVMLTKYGIFPNFRDPRVLWAGLENNATLDLLYTRTRMVLNLAEINTENRKYIPHLTLARIRQVNDLHKFNQSFSKFPAIDGIKMWIERMVFYQSILRPEGVEYLEIASAKLT